MTGLRELARPIALAALLVSCAGTVLAACPQELAVYSEADAGASLEFSPAGPDAVTTHAFRVIFPENAVTLDGMAMTSEEIARSRAILMNQCPEGDVTGAELAECTVWEGTAYAVGEAGAVSGPLPAQGAAAARQIVLADLAFGLRESSVWGVTGLSKLPGDVFTLSGCQE